MTDATPVAPRIVVLRFASGIRVDLVHATERDAIADFTSRAIQSGQVELPLFEALTAAVPISRLRDLTGTAEPEQQSPPRPSLSVTGMLGAVRRYMEAVAGSREQEEARDTLREFFERYGVDLDFRVAAPMRKAAE